MVLSLQINTSFILLAKMGGVCECSLFYNIGLREMMMGLDYLGEADGCIAFDMLAMVCMGVPCDLIGKVGV